LCMDDSDCAEPTPFCTPSGCQAGEGAPCSSDSQCPDVAPYCNPDGACQDGSEGDPCGGGGQTDCSPEAPRCASDGRCYDRSAGDPCNNDAHCESGTCNGDACA
jgi:hypothetical protein